eukprot:GHUV01014663.1.p1 GENE.GHUV01014663.1~~GHUV01014663.1.p1  ORF type:complete len:201 (+),score=16.93 GHUV01014663.1:222-824(+)
MLLQSQSGRASRQAACGSFTNGTSPSAARALPRPNGGSKFTAQRPFFNQSTEIHATLKESLLLDQPRLSFNGSNGFVPGRPVLEVPGWKDRYTQAAAASSSMMNSLSRLRIFSGTSNPVSFLLLLLLAVCWLPSGVSCPPMLCCRPAGLPALSSAASAGLQRLRSSSWNTRITLLRLTLSPAPPHLLCRYYQPRWRHTWA